jgi:hypothetical protein
MAEKPSFDSDKLKTLKNELKMALVLNHEELEPVLNESLQRYVGKYVSAYSRDWDIVLNDVYPIIQAQLPAIFYRNPRAFLKPRQKTFIAKRRNPISGQMEEVQLDSVKSANTQEAILNYCLGEMKFKQEVRKVLLDALIYPYGILWHGYKGDFGMTEEQAISIKNEKVFVRRIAPLRFIHDPNVGTSTIDEAKWIGRVIDIPIADFFEDDKLYIRKDLMKGYRGYGQMVGTKSREALIAQGVTDYLKLTSSQRSLIDFTTEDFKNTNLAKFIRVFEIYMRPSKKEAREGKRGNILLISQEQDEPHRVSPWTIKAEGFPIQILEFNELPDNMFGLSDISTYKDICDQKNAIINLQLRNAHENSKVWVGLSKEGANEEDIEKVQRGDQTIVTFESGDPRQRMYVASPGGSASSELYLIDGRLQKNLEDKSGVTDLRRGFLQSGEESAASVKIRAAGGSARPAYRQDLMADFLKASLLYINQLNKQFMTYEDAVRIMGSMDIEWSEKPTKDELQADVDVEIDVISMLPENPEKEMQELQMILTLMVQALSDPNVKQKITEEGKTVNLSPIIEQMLMRLKLRDPDIFRNIRPEESQGFVSVAEIREAKQNVAVALASPPGSPVPFPPKPENDHVAKLEIYTAIQQLLKQAGQVSDTLDQLIQIHMALLQQIQEKESTPGQSVHLPKPSVAKV